MKRSLLLASFLLLQPLAANADICTDLAGAIRQGEGSSLGEIARASSGHIQVQNRADRVPKQFVPEDFDNPTMYPLGKDGAVVVINTQGSMHCQTPAFFDQRKSGVTRIAGPDTLSSDGDAYCWDSYLLVSSVNGVPALIAETDSDDRVSLEATGWVNHGWTGTCKLEAAFKPALLVDQAYSAGGVTPSLEAQALAAAGRYRSKTKSALGSGEQDRKLLAMGAALSKPGEIPQFGKTSSNPYTMFANSVFETVEIDGERLLAEVGGGSFGWRDYRGYLVAFWRDAGGKPAPVASFQISLGKSTPVSLRITPDVKPQGTAR